MEENPQRRIYFIFSQKPGERLHYKIEENEIINNIKILKQDRTENYNYDLYSISLNNMDNKKSFSILLNSDGQYFIAQIECNKIYPEIFLYKVEFKSMEKNSSIEINQIQLSISEQFCIFKSHFKNDINATKYLLLNSFDIIVSANKEKKFDFYFLFFLFGNALYLYIKNKDENLLSTFFNFFQLDFIDIKNSYKKNFPAKNISDIIGQETIEILNDINKIYNIISSLEINKEQNKKNLIIHTLDILLAYYYINYNKKLFIKLLYKEYNPRFQQISDNLIKNRKIFLNFTNEVINYDLLTYAENLDEIYYVFLLVPNEPELIKIMGEYMTFFKLEDFCRRGKKVVNVFKIIKPKKEDDMKLFNDYFDILKEHTMREDFAPFILHNDLFNNYCELFYQKDLNKIEQVIELYKKNIDCYKKYYPVIDPKIYEGLYLDYYETGVFLVKNGKLINKDFISFIDKLKNKFRKELQITEEFSKALVPSNDAQFVKDLILGENKNSELLSKYYFNNFTLKDFANPTNNVIFKCNNNKIIKNCYESLKQIWIKENPKVNGAMGEFIAHLFIKYFHSYQDQENIDELKVFEIELNKNELLMDIYGLVIKKFNDKYYTPNFDNHIYEFIDSHYYEVDIMSIYYKLLITNKNEKEDYLLSQLNVELAVKLEDIIDYPTKIHPRIKLFTKLYNEGFMINNRITNLEYYKLSIEVKNNITSLKYKSAIKISKNLGDIYQLFIFFIPNRTSDEEDYLIANQLFDFNDLIDICKGKYNSLKLILSYFKHFFSTKKKAEVNSLEELIQNLDETPLSQFNKMEVKIDSFLVNLNEAEKYDKLFNSFFFMGIYNNAGNIFLAEEDVERFQYSLMQFNEIEVLGNISDIDTLNKELLEQLVEFVYKNKERLDDELDFIKEYFNFEENPNFDIHRIKKSFLDKVNNYQKKENLADYQINFDNFNLIEGQIDTSTTKNIKPGDLSLNNNQNSSDFSLFAKDENNEIKNEIIVEKGIDKEEMNKILKDINSRKNEYYYIYRIFKSFDVIEGNISFNEKYTSFFNELFENIKIYEPLSNKQFYEEVIILSMKVFLSGMGIDYFKNENDNKNEMYIVNEFFDILELYKKYNKLSKQKLFNIIEKLVEYKKNKDEEIINIIASIENLFNEISDNIQKKSISNLFIRILCQEKIKINLNEFNHKLVEFSFRNDNIFLINDITPLLDEIFNEDINSKLILDNDMREINAINFQEEIYNPIEKILNNSKEPKIARDLEEIILYYFESKISYIFSKYKKSLENKKDFYQNEDIKKYLQKSLFILEDEFNKKYYINNKKISLLFNIAYIKSFLSDYVNYLYNFNQEIGDVKDINENIIKGNANNKFRTMIRLYILKLFYNIFGNFPDFIDFNYNLYQIYYFQEKDIKNINNQDELIDTKNKIFGFDFLFLPLRQDELQGYISIEKRMINLSRNENKDINELITMINLSENLDIVLCVIINIFLSNFKDKYYFDTNTYKNLSTFLYDNLTNNKFIRIKNLLSDVLLFFIDLEKYTQTIINNKDMNYGTHTLSYDQILSLSFSLRFVFNTLLGNNENSLLYQLLIGKQNKNIFIEFYNKDYSYYKSRNINQLTFAIIKFIFLSHIYFGFLLNKINGSNINDIFGNLDENIRLIDLIENEFKLIQKILALKGIKNIIVFMNYLFNDIKLDIVNISLNNNLNEEILINFETKIENEISKYLENFSYYFDEYNTMIEKMENNIIFKNNELRNIIIENKNFYNGKNVEKEYPFIKYLTLTNFCGIDDFKNQFNYLINDKSNYPLINCLINNSDIITISKNLPFINSFFNEINNELMLKIRSDDINKTAGEILNEDIKSKFNEYNEKINEINQLDFFASNDNKINEINNDTKILDVINIKDNSLNKMFDNIIKIYNEFLTSTKIYKDNKNLIESLIIQEATKNDFINLSSNKEENNNNEYEQNNMTIFERLEQLLYSYSKRNRFYKNDLNVFNGSKINYDLTQIEYILEKEYLYGKRPFKLEQRNFIFANEIFNGNKNNLIENLMIKYPQEEIKDNPINAEINKFFNDEYKKKNDFERIYISLQYLIIFLEGYNDNNFVEEVQININNYQKYNLYYLCKIIRKKNYHVNELLSEFLKNYNDGFGINNLLFLYSKAEIKYFDFISEEISQNNNIIKENNKNVEDFFKEKNNELLINELVLLDGIKKYIMRYCVGDNQNKNEIMKKIDLKNILEKKSIWYNIDLNNEKIKNEINKLLELNEGDNLMKYAFKKLFGSNKKIEKKKKDILEDDEGQIKRNRNRRKRMNY